MGDINSKNCIESIHGSALMQSRSAAPGKSNIIIMNPEIHLHSDGGHPSAPTSTHLHNEERIKKLQEELKLKDGQIELERQMRELEQYHRQAESVKTEKRIREKENLIEDQNAILSQHVKLLEEQRACLEEGYMYGRREQRANNGRNKTVNQQQWNRKNTHQSTNYNRSLTNNHFNTKKKGHHHHPYQHHHRGNRNRSKSEPNFQNDPMELWEWNGTKWVMIKSNDTQQNGQQQVGEVASSKDGHQQPNLNSAVTSGSNVSEGSTSGTLSTEVARQVAVVYEGQTDGTSQINVPMTSTVCEFQTEAASQPEPTKSAEVIDFDDTAEQINQINSTFWSQLHAASQLTNFTNISISFDDREISRYFNHDETLFPIPKRVKQSK